MEYSQNIIETPEFDIQAQEETLVTSAHNETQHLDETHATANVPLHQNSQPDNDAADLTEVGSTIDDAMSDFQPNMSSQEFHSWLQQNGMLKIKPTQKTNPLVP